MPTKCIALFSGGLDSVIAVHLLRQQNIEVVALHFVLPFDLSEQSKQDIVIQSAGQLGVPLRIEPDGDSFVSMIKNPLFGFGKHANPCTDCRIRRLVVAKQIMDQESAQFVATGEVIGQRPMSQRRDSLDIIERHSGLAGRLLRPLSAGLLVPTIAEKEGLVDRNRLLSIKGRGRRDQIAYAKQFGLVYQPPAGGCILTHDGAAQRLSDLALHVPEFSHNDLRLIAIGRHFRIAKDLRFIVSRDESENQIIESLFLPGDCRIEMAGLKGPIGLARGRIDDEGLIQTCSGILARYSRARDSAKIPVKVLSHEQITTIEATPSGPGDCDARRIGANVQGT